MIDQEMVPIVDHDKVELPIADSSLLQKRWINKKTMFRIIAATVLVAFTAVGPVYMNKANSKEKNRNENTAAEKNKRPNLIFIMTDQQKYDALSIAGNEVLHTPNMDRIAREGAFFTNTYTQCPVCGPARTCLLTGQTIENTKIRTNEMTKVSRNATTYDEYLVRKEGYVAEYYGKFHSPKRLKRKYQNKDDVSQNKVVFPYREYLSSVNLTRPSVDQMKNGTQIQSFDDYPYRTNPLDNRHGLPPGSTTSNKKGEENIRVHEPDQHGVSEIPKEHTLTAYEAKLFLQALERLAAENNDDQPFSLHLSFNRPHSPITPSEPYSSMFNIDDMVPPASIGDPMENSPYVDANGRRRLTQYADPYLIKFMIADYYACVKEIDDWLGKILDKIDELGLASNTLLVFTSDHGEMLGAHGMREKNVFYEESVHVPLMMRFPGVIPPGTVIDDPVSHINVFSTILDYLGAKPQVSDGESLRPKIERQTRTEQHKHSHATAEESYAVSEWNWDFEDPGWQPGLMIRTKRWKLIIPNTAKSKVLNVLYDLKNDPNEMTNLLGTNPNRPFYLIEAEKLKAMLVEWLTKVHSPHLEEVKKRQL